VCDESLERIVTAVDGTPLVLINSDITPIKWDTASGTYTTGGGTYNGVRIIAHRSAARSTAIPLTFAKMIGMSSCDISATSIAYCGSGLPPYGVVGISGTLIQNNTITIDSYNSAAGSYGGANAFTHGYVATNGGITLTGGVTINKDIYMLSGQSITANGSPNYGTRQTLSASLSYPGIASAPVGSTNLGNVNGGTTLGSGSSNTNYVANGINLNSGQSLNINGPVTLYVSGNLTLNGTVNVLNNLPSNFAIRMLTGSGGVNIQTTTLYADIYSPQTVVNINPGTTIYGRVIGNNLNISGSAAIHYDEGLPALPGATQAPPSSGGSSAAASLE